MAARRKVRKKDRRAASSSKPAVYFKHEYRFRSVTGVLTALAYPGAFAVVTLGLFGWVVWVTCSYVLLAFGIVVGDFDKARLDAIAPSLLVFIPFGAIFGWVTYRMGLKFPRNIVRDARFDVYISEIGIIIGSVFYTWEDITRVGYSHILPFCRGFLEFRFGEDDYWIPTRQWIPWREYRKLTQSLKEHLQPDYPHLRFPHFSFGGKLHPPEALLALYDPRPVEIPTSSHGGGSVDNRVEE